MLVKLSIILFSNSHIMLTDFTYIILKIMLGLMLMAFQTTNNIATTN